MLYLALHFVWFLVAAFAIGLVFGWLTCRGGLRGLLSGPISPSATPASASIRSAWRQFSSLSSRLTHR